MIKKTAFILSAVLLILSLSLSVFAESESLEAELYSQQQDSFVLKLTLGQSIKVTVDGEQIKFTEDFGKPFEQNDRIYVSARQLLEMRGFALSYEDETETVIAVNAQTGDYLAVQIGNPLYNCNGKSREFDTAPVLKQDRTFIPVRILFEMLGCEVSYDEATRTAAIVTAK